jgi:hypothetical protein
MIPETQSTYFSIPTGRMTIREYFDKLPEYINKIVYKEVKQESNLDYIVDNFGEALELAFYWDETSFDPYYWEQLSCGLAPEIEVVLRGGPYDGKKINIRPLDHYQQYEIAIYEYVTYGRYKFVQLCENDYVITNRSHPAFVYFKIKCYGRLGRKQIMKQSSKNEFVMEYEEYLY